MLIIINRKYIFYILLMFVCIYFSSCIDSGNLENAIAFNNTSGRTILIYIKESNVDSLIDIGDKRKIEWGAEDSLYCCGTSINPYSSKYIHVKEYCDKNYWENHIVNDTMLVFIFDRNMLLETQNIQNSLLKILPITYEILYNNNCGIVYSE